jgi:hypothetical protein
VCPDHFRYAKASIKSKKNLSCPETSLLRKQLRLRNISITLKYFCNLNYDTGLPSKSTYSLPEYLGALWDSKPRVSLFHNKEPSKREEWCA